MKTTIVQEGKVKLIVPDSKKYKLDSKMPVFYNPVMQLNRDISVILLKALRFNGKALDLMSASGSRAIRLKKETKADVTANDINPSARKLIKKNASLNKVALTITLPVQENVGAAQAVGHEPPQSFPVSVPF